MSCKRPGIHPNGRVPPYPNRRISFFGLTRSLQKAALLFFLRKHAEKLNHDDAIAARYRSKQRMSLEALLQMRL
jgi:hypothetical protein